MRVHTTKLTKGITRTIEFEKKGLAQFAVNVGTKCGHDCVYCSTGAMLRMHRSFKQVDENPFGFGYAIVDPSTPDRVPEDARRMKKRGLIQLCTTVDAWAPEAKQHEFGRRCLEAILAQPGWSVRILTKNAAVADDFDFIEQHRDRVMVGLSITATADKEQVVGVLEPNASPISKRMKVMNEAHDRGLRTYAMLCPLLPGIADATQSVNELVGLAMDVGAEEVFVEAVNGRGPGLGLCQDALEAAGHQREADAVGAIRKQAAWSTYAVELLIKVQDALDRRGALDKLRYLLYPSHLTDQDRRRVELRPQGVRWLGR